MIRRFLPRISLFRPVAAPLLPLTSRLRISTPRILNPRSFHHVPARLTSPPPSPPPSPNHRPPLPPDATLSQRLRHLIKTYGWYTLGVYAVLSTLDLGVAFAGINLLGAEQVARLAAAAKALLASAIHSAPPEPGRDEIDSTVSAGGHEGFYAMLVLAYTVHKTLFLPVRVGLTAALTPKLVSWLGQRGWVGGDGARRAASEMRERIRNRRG